MLAEQKSHCSAPEAIKIKDEAVSSEHKIKYWSYLTYFPFLQYIIE